MRAQTDSLLPSGVQEAHEELDDFDDANTAGPSQSLLPGSNDTPRKSRIQFGKEFEMTRLGMIRAYWLGAVVSSAGFLFGYDTAIIGGVLTLNSFGRDFRYGENSTDRVESLAVGLQQLGAFVACFAVWPLTHRYGRKYTIVGCSFVFIIGAMIQTINTHSLPAFYVGRVIAGLGLGGASTIVPMMSSEMTPKQIRGQVGSFFQLMFTFGIFTSYWVNYGTANNIPDTEYKQWGLPVGLQMLFAFLLGSGMFTLKESVRWLTAVGRHEEAWESLKWIRASEEDDVHLEMEEIRAGVEMEAHAREGFQLKEMVQGGNLRRTLTAAGVFIAQQSTGATAFAYFSPQYFSALAGDSGTRSLLLSGIFGAVKIIACLTFVIFVGDRLPRRWVLTGGAVFMAVCRSIVAGLNGGYGVPEDGTITSSGIGSVALIYLFVMGYNFSWGPLPWPYVAEIFPTRTREAGVAVGVSMQWAFNLLYSSVTPYMISSLGWGTFLLWGVFNAVIAAYAWFGLIETAGKSIEEITHLDQGGPGIVKTDTEAEDVEVHRTKT